MKMSKRAQRMDKHQKRGKRSMPLNMVSLMDIFTILVFFLLVNSSTGEVLPSTKSIKLPESISEQKPKETVTIVINEKDILIQGRKVAGVTEEINSSNDIIEGLKDELILLTGSRLRTLTGDTPFNGEVTIMAHKEIPYQLLKKIMVTCTKASYGNISLAVMQKIDKG